MSQIDLMGIYQEALNTIEGQIEQLHREQKQHLACKKGCDACCMDTFRVRYIELLYLLQGFFAASPETRRQILKNLQDPVLKEQKRCPVLINGACSLYQNRPTLCRAYGVMIQLDGQVSTCGLNYREKKPDEGLSVLDLGPVYDLMNHLSDLAWQQMTGETDVSPMLTIRQFLENVLANELKRLTPSSIQP